MPFDNQLSDDDVHRLYQEKRFNEIAAAQAEGRLDRLLGVPDEDIALVDYARWGELDADDIRDLTALRRPDLIEAARIDGRIDYPTTNKEN